MSKEKRATCGRYEDARVRLSWGLVRLAEAGAVPTVFHYGAHLPGDIACTTFGFGPGHMPNVGLDVGLVRQSTGPDCRNTGPTIPSTCYSGSSIVGSVNKCMGTTMSQVAWLSCCSPLAGFGTARCVLWACDKARIRLLALRTLFEWTTSSAAGFTPGFQMAR